MTNNTANKQPNKKQTIFDRIKQNQEQPKQPEQKKEQQKEPKQEVKKGYRWLKRSGGMVMVKKTTLDLQEDTHKALKDIKYYYSTETNNEIVERAVKELLNRLKAQEKGIE